MRVAAEDGRHAVRERHRHYGSRGDIHEGTDRPECRSSLPPLEQSAAHGHEQRGQQDVIAQHVEDDRPPKGLGVSGGLSHQALGVEDLAHVSVHGEQEKHSAHHTDDEG